MKRDMNLWRKILFYVEEHYELGDFPMCDVEMEDYDEYIVREHCKLLIEAQLLNDLDPKTAKVLTLSHGGIYVGNLTNAGYDFLETIRPDTIWNKTKETIAKEGLPLMIKTIGIVASSIIKSTTEGITKAIIGS